MDKNRLRMKQMENFDKLEKETILVTVIKITVTIFLIWLVVTLIFSF